MDNTQGWTPKTFKDGNAWCAVWPDFVNLQESPAAFGDTEKEAIEALVHPKPLGWRQLSQRWDGIVEYLVRYSDGVVKRICAHYSYNLPYYHFDYYHNDLKNPLPYEPNLKEQGAAYN